MIFIFIMFSFNILMQTEVIYTNDINHIQSHQLSLYSSTIPMAPTIFNYTLQYLQSFSTLPIVIVGITEFDIHIPSGNVFYILSLSNVTISSMDFNLMIDLNTNVYSTKVCLLALDIPNIEIVSYSYSCQPCSYISTLNFNLSQTFPIKFLIGYSLTGFSFNNSYFPTLYIQFYLDSHSVYHISLTMFKSTIIKALVIQYIVVDQITYFSGNFSYNWNMTFLNTTQNSFFIIKDGYSQGHSSSPTETFFGLRNFKFDATLGNLKFTATLIQKQIILSNIDQFTSLGIFWMTFAIATCPPNTQISYSPILSCCPLSCLTCQYTLCGSCDISLNRYLQITNFSTNGGICSCLPRFYQINSMCMVCDKICYQCSGSSNNCTNCFPGYTLKNNNCSIFCMVQYSTGFNNCSSCAPGCSSCQNSTVCTIFKCPHNIYYYNSCINNCPNGTFYEVDTSSCMKCNQICVTCENFITCSVCIQNHFLNQLTKMCFECFQSCKTCANPSYNACYTCKQYYILNNNQCQSPKHYDSLVKNVCQNFQNCLICDNLKCTVCFQNYLLINNTCRHCTDIQGMLIYKNKCLEICGDGISIFQQCDDGNKQNGDGCSNLCQIQHEYDCKGNQSESNICDKQADIIEIKISKSLINNQIKIKFTSNTYSFTNMGDVNSSLDQLMNYTESSTKSQYTRIITYNKDLINQTFQISFSKDLIFSIKLKDLRPKAHYFEDSQITKSIKYSLILKYLSIASMSIILLTHLMCNQLPNSIFMSTIQLYILSLFNIRYISPIVYNFIPELKYFLLLYNINIGDLEKNKFTEEYMFNITSNNFAFLAENIYVLFSIYLLILILLILGQRMIDEKIKKIYNQYIKDYMLFFYYTFGMFQTILFFDLLINVKNSYQAQSITLEVLSILFILFFTNYSMRKRPQLIKFYGYHKCKVYVIVMSVWLYRNSLFNLYCLISINIASIMMRLIKRKQLYTIARFKHKLIKFQLIYNQIFLLINTLLIYYVYLLEEVAMTSNNNKKSIMIAGWINIYNLLVFIVINMIILILLLCNKLYRIYFQKLWYKKKQESEVIDVSEQYHSRQVTPQQNNSDKQKNSRNLDTKNSFDNYMIQDSRDQIFIYNPT